MYQQIDIPDKFTSTRSFWFIITDQGSDTYYLKKYNKATNVAHWTRNCENATAFMNEHRAEQYKILYFDKRCDVGIVEHELTL